MSAITKKMPHMPNSITRKDSITVSYTHLDVYKRQMEATIHTAKAMLINFFITYSSIFT